MRAANPVALRHLIFLLVAAFAALGGNMARAQNFTYTTNGDGSLNITGYTGTDTTVTIPGTILVNGVNLTVTSIGSYAFDSSNLTSVTIPDSVTSLGYGAFFACESLASVTLGHGVASVGNYAFYICDSLTTITLPASVTSLGEYVFEYSGLTSVYFQGNAPNADSTVFANGDSPTVYYLSGTSGWGSTFAGLSTVMLIPPVITAQPANRTVNAGLTATFTSAASGNPTPAYQWQNSTDGGNTWSNLSDGNGISGSITGTLTVSGITTAMSGNKFQLVATNSVSSATSNAATLTVLPAGQVVVTAVSAGGDFSLFLKSDGSLWAMGDNTRGALGDGTTNEQTTNTQTLPEQIVPSGVVAISAGGAHSLFLKSDGSLWAMGDNTYGQLGDGTTTKQNIPEQIVPSNVVAISAGAAHSLFLKSDGSLWAMGDNTSGQLGDGTTTNRSTSEQIAVGVTAIAAGVDHSLFIESDGSLWGMGDNGNGELVDDSFTELGDDGTFTTNDGEDNTPKKIIAGDVTAIAAGGYFSLFLKSDGSLWGMGYNQDGQLGDGTPNDNLYTPEQSTPNYNRYVAEQIVANSVTAISTGYAHSLFLKSNGSLWGMGDNEFGDLGDGTTNQQNIPEQIVIGGVTTIAAGGINGGFSLFLKSDGSLWGMGYNGNGQLGDGTIISRNTLEQIYPIIPTITSQPGIQSLVAGNNATFTVAASGAPAPTFQWQVSTNGGQTWANLSDNSLYSGSATATLTVIGSPISLNSDQFQCVVTNYAGAANSNPVALTVQPAYIYTNLGVQADSVVLGMNNSGEIVGTAAGNSDGLPHAFLYSNGMMAYLGNLPGASSSQATAINDSGQIVGFSPGLNSSAIAHAFLYSNGTMTDLGVLGGTASYAYGINNSGQIVGYFLSGEEPFGFLYSNGTMTDLGSLYGSNGASEAFGINASGQIVGQSITANGLNFDAFLYSNGTMTDLGFITGFGTQIAINDSGQIVGAYPFAGGNGNNHAYMYSNGTLTDLGTLPSGTYRATASEANAINASGQIVGESAFTSGPSHAFVYANGAMTDLNNLVSTPGILAYAGAINDRGQIAGYANGEVGGGTLLYLLTPVSIATAPIITTPPVSQLTTISQNAVFTVTASGLPAPFYQWQVSTDGGNTWTNLTDGSAYTGSATGTLTVNAPAAALSGYQFQAVLNNGVGAPQTSAPVNLVVGTSAAQLTWLQKNFTTAQLGNPAISGDLATPAKDGIPNLIKYAFNLNPWMDGHPYLPQPTLSAGNLTLTFQALQSDLTYTVQASTDLINWSNVTTQTNGTQMTASHSLSGQTPVFLQIVVAPAP